MSSYYPQHNIAHTHSAHTRTYTLAGVEKLSNTIYTFFSTILIGMNDITQRTTAKRMVLQQ